MKMKSYFSFLRILSELSWFCNILGSGNVHNSIVYNELNIYYYLKMLLPLLNDIKINVFHYQIQNDIFAKIIIGNTQYNIINLIEPNHIDDPFSMVQYHLYIMELEKIETSDVCILLIYFLFNYLNIILTLPDINCTYIEIHMFKKAI